MHRLSAPVETLLRQAAETIVLPRFRNLATRDIEEKSPGELVTVADRESEAWLAEGLHRLLPDARMLGEEAVAANPSLMDGIGLGAVWIIDPIDGTSNFAEGKPHFAIMVALAIDGVAQAGWILDPLSGRMCHAVRGYGAFIDDRRVMARGSGAAHPVAAIATLFMAPEERENILDRIEGHMTLASIPRCAGEQYPRVVLGVNDIALFQRTLPWDHVPGVLFLEEAGGKAARADGSPYRFADGGRGLLSAASPDLWDRAAAILYG